MNTAVLREKIHQLINNASDESLQIIYQTLGTVVSPAKNWWEDKNIIREFDSRVKSWLTNDETGYSLEDIDEEIKKRKNS